MPEEGKRSFLARLHGRECEGINTGRLRPVGGKVIIGGIERLKELSKQ